MKSPVHTPVHAASVPEPDISTAGANAIAFAILYSLILATGGAYVFYSSIRPVSIQKGYGDILFDWPWILAFLLLAVVWLAGPLALLIAGLIHLHRTARRTWWSAVAWVCALAAGTAIGFVIMRDYSLLLTSYPRDADGSPLGPSRFAPGTPYWQALAATGGQLAVGAIMIALIAGVGQARGQASQAFVATPPTNR